MLEIHQANMGAAFWAEERWRACHMFLNGFLHANIGDTATRWTKMVLHCKIALS